MTMQEEDRLWPERAFVSTQELGALLGVTRQTIRNWIKKGEIKAYHIGQHLKIPAKEAVAILQNYELPVPDWLGGEAGRRYQSGKTI